MSGPLNLHIWKHFLAIAEAGSFTRAAMQLRVAQPALSREMAELERGMGTKLFVRHARGVRLSATGEQFRHRAREILQEIHELPHRLADAEDEPTGALSVGVPPSMSGLIVNRAVKLFLARFPTVRMNVAMLAGEECYERLVERQLDIAVIASRRGQRGIDVEPLLTENIGLFGAHDLLKGIPKEIGMRELAQIPLMLSPDPSLVYDLLSTELIRNGLRLNIALEGNLWAISELVRHGVGISVFSECAKGTFDPASIGFVRIMAPPNRWLIATLAYRPTTPAASAFSRILREVVEKQIPGPAALRPAVD